jgi:hypothetical protein
MTTFWRQFTATFTLFFLGDIPPRRRELAIWSAVGFVLFILTPTVVWLSWENPNQQRNTRSALDYFWIVTLLPVLLRELSNTRTAARMRAKGYDPKLPEAGHLWKKATMAAAFMGNLRTRHELLRALPSREELQLTPLFNEEKTRESLESAIHLMARTTQRYRILQRGEARRRRAGA